MALLQKLHAPSRNDELISPSLNESSQGRLLCDNDSTSLSTYSARSIIMKELFGPELETSSFPQGPHHDPAFALMSTLIQDDGMDSPHSDAIRTSVEKGADLQALSTKLTADLRIAENALVKDYITKVPELRLLKDNISVCDQFLNSMTRHLQGFQSDLAVVSKELAELEMRSKTLGLGYKNRQALHVHLNDVVGTSVLSPGLIQFLVDGDINEEYQDSVLVLDAKMSFVKKNKTRHIRAFKDVGPELERLRNKVADRVRDFFLDKIKALRNSNTNLQMHQSNVLLRFKPTHDFLLQWHPEVAQEVRGHYVHIVARYHQALFEKYIKTLDKLLVEGDEQKLVGNTWDESRDGIMGSTKAFLKAPLAASGLSTRQSVGQGPTRFALGDRARFLRDVDFPVIMVHGDDSRMYSVEHIVRSVIRMLVDTLSTEYGFDSVFFLNRRTRLGTPAAIAQAVFVQVFEPTLKIVATFLGSCVNSSSDVVSLAICAKVLQQHAKILDERGISVTSLTAFLGGLRDQVFERYSYVMALHQQSLVRLSNTQSGLVTIAQSYAELASTILSLNLEPLVSPLQNVRTSLESLIQVKEASDSKLVQVILYHDSIALILEENANTLFGGSPQVLQYERECQYWQKNTHRYAMDLVDALLHPSFGFLFDFVDSTEPQVPLNAVSANSFEDISNQFGHVWRSSLSNLAAAIHQYFPHCRQGTVILQAALAQISVYWQRFHGLLDKRFGKGTTPFLVAPIGDQNISVEFKKYCNY